MAPGTDPGLGQVWNQPRTQQFSVESSNFVQDYVCLKHLNYRLRLPQFRLGTSLSFLLGLSTLAASKHLCPHLRARIQYGLLLLESCLSILPVFASLLPVLLILIIQILSKTIFVAIPIPHVFHQLPFFCFEIFHPCVADLK